MRGNGRVIPAALAAVTACSALALAAVSAAGAATAATTDGAGHSRTARPAAAAATAPVIIFLRNAETGAASPVGSAKRLDLVRAAQAPYLAWLARLGATGVHRYRLGRALRGRGPRAPGGGP